MPFVPFQKREKEAAMKERGQNHKYVRNRDEQKRGDHDPRKLVGQNPPSANRRRKTCHTEQHADVEEKPCAYLQGEETPQFARNGAGTEKG